MSFEKYAPAEYIDMRDAKGEVIEWINMDYREKNPLSNYTPEQLRLAHELEKEAQKRKVLLLFAILSILALVSVALLR
jgi:hypothetical protein